MEEITQQLIDEFNFKAKSIRKSKYMYICRNEREARAIKLSSQSPEQIFFVEAVKNNLIKNGFKNVDKYYTSSQQKPFLSTENGNYVMTDYIDYQEADFSSINQMREITYAVGQLHKLGSGFSLYYDEFKGYNPFIRFEKGIKRLRDIKKIICNQKKYSDFDIIFIKNYESHINDAIEALEILKNSKINQLIEESKKRHLFCHNALKEENILNSPKGIYFTGFDCAANEHYVFDLYQLIERYMRKHSQEFLSLKEILDIYFESNERDERVYPVLFGLLKYPSRFIRVCDSFYSKKRSWVPNSTKEQLDEILSLREANKNYIKDISVI